MPRDEPPAAPAFPDPPVTALLGGSFDPPHVCHLLISLYVLQSGEADEVWWVPCRQHAFDKRSAPFEARMAMCELATRWVPRVHVDPVEQELAGPSYTVETVAALRRRDPGRRFVWIVGSDVLYDLPRWHRWRELATALPFLVVRRGDGVEAPPPDGSFRHLPVRFPDVSSTDVRARLARGERARGLVDPGIVAYAREQGLYDAVADGRS